MPTTPAPGRVVAITGACTYLGGELLRRLAEDPRYDKVLALDIRPPALAPDGKIEFIKLDLTQPTVDAELATLMARRKVDTFVHGAFLSHPTHAAEWAHELEDVGTMHVLNACAGVEPRSRRIPTFASTSSSITPMRNPATPLSIFRAATCAAKRPWSMRCVRWTPTRSSTTWPASSLVR